LSSPEFYNDDSEEDMAMMLEFEQQKVMGRIREELHDQKAMMQDVAGFFQPLSRETKVLLGISF